MKSSGGRKRKSSNAGAWLLIIILLAVVAGALWMVFSEKDGKNPGKNPGGNQDGNQVIETDGTTHKILLNSSKLPDAVSPVQTTDEKGATIITLSGNSATVEGSGAAADGSEVLINRAGTYHISGTLENGRIIVDAKGEDVVLILDGVNITCGYSSVLYIYKAETVTLIANGTTENVFTDSSNYDFTFDLSDPVAGEPNAAVFSKADLIIRGTGSVKVNGKYSAGIIGKDSLKIINTNLTVDAVNNGINGKDSLVIQNSNVKVTAGKDGLRSTNDTDPALGYASFTDSNITVEAGGDGVQVETGLIVTNCSLNIVTGGGSYNAADSSQKGIKCNQGYVTFESGHIVLDCSDDAVNAYGDVNVNSGVINISTGDDGIHSDSSVKINGGTLVISKCQEGIEGMAVEMNGGSTYINSKSDAINAAGGSDGTGFDGAGSRFEVNEQNSVNITGGYIFANTDGDGLDSNGSVVMSGGTFIINGPTSDGNGAVDYNGSFTVEGGTLLSTGSRAMAQAPDKQEQSCVSVTFDGTVGTGTFIRISCAGEEFVFKTEKPIENLVFSAPFLKQGEECVVTYGGRYSGGENIDNVYSGGRYSGGTEIRLVLESGLTAYGRVGVGGSAGSDPNRAQ